MKIVALLLLLPAAAYAGGGVVSQSCTSAGCGAVFSQQAVQSHIQLIPTQQIVHVPVAVKTVTAVHTVNAVNVNHCGGAQINTVPLCGRRSVVNANRTIVAVGLRNNINSQRIRVRRRCW